MKFVIILLFVTSFTRLSFSQDIQKSDAYLGQTPPDNIAKKFDLAVDPGCFASDRIAISSDGKEIYYSEISDLNWSRYRIKYYRFSNGRWSGAQILHENFIAPALSSDDNNLYIEAYSENFSSYCSSRNGTSWNTPSPSLFKKAVCKHYLQVTGRGNYYASSNNPVGGLGAMDISKFIISSTDTIIQSLDTPLNSKGNEGDFYISRDESYIIFASPHRGGFGGPDLFISFRNDDAKWTAPLNLGSTINTPGWDYGPYVTADNKYLFFTSGNSLSNLGIYWVKADDLIESLRVKAGLTKASGK